MEDATTAVLSELTVNDLVARLASRDPVPGGGSAAAIAGAMGAALIGMVVELTAGRPAAEGHEGLLAELRSSSDQRRVRLLQLAQDDAAAYQAVVHARRLPRESEAEAEQRRVALDVAMHAAAEVPLAVARLALEVLEDAVAVAPVGNPNAVSDAGVAGLLAATAVRGAILNVQINLPYLPQEDSLGGTAPGELQRLRARTQELEETVQATVGERMKP